MTASSVTDSELVRGTHRWRKNDGDRLHEAWRLALFRSPARCSLATQISKVTLRARGVPTRHAVPAMGGRGAPGSPACLHAPRGLEEHPPILRDRRPAARRHEEARIPPLRPARAGTHHRRAAERRVPLRLRLRVRLRGRLRVRLRARLQGGCDGDSGHECAYTYDYEGNASTTTTMLQVSTRGCGHEWDY